MTTKTYLDRCLKDNLLVRWPDQVMPLPVYIAPFRWHEKSKQQSAQMYENYVYEALVAWSAATQGAFRFRMVNRLYDSHINVDWRRVDRKSLGHCEYVITDNMLVYSAELSIGLSDGKVHSKYDDPQEVKHTILHEVGHALGLIGHSTSKADMMYTPHQYGITNLSQRDLDSAYWLYKLPPGFDWYATGKKLGLEDPFTIHHVIAVLAGDPLPQDVSNPPPPKEADYNDTTFQTLNKDGSLSESKPMQTSPQTTSASPPKRSESAAAAAKTATMIQAPMGPPEPYMYYGDIVLAYHADLTAQQKARLEVEARRKQKRHDDQAQQKQAEHKPAAEEIHKSQHKPAAPPPPAHPAQPKPQAAHHQSPPPPPPAQAISKPKSAENPAEKSHPAAPPPKPPQGHPPQAHQPEPAHAKSQPPKSPSEEGQPGVPKAPPPPPTGYRPDGPAGGPKQPKEADGSKVAQVQGDAGHPLGKPTPKPGELTGSGQPKSGGPAMNPDPRNTGTGAPREGAGGVKPNLNALGSAGKQHGSEGGPGKIKLPDSVQAASPKPKPPGIEASYKDGTLHLNMNRKPQQTEPPCAHVPFNPSAPCKNCGKVHPPAQKKPAQPTPPAKGKPADDVLTRQQQILTQMGQFHFATQDITVDDDLRHQLNEDQRRRDQNRPI